MRTLVIGLLALCCAAPAVARTELPVREVVLSDGARRYATTLRIDGRDVVVGIDTGSVGLRVLARALGDTARAARGNDTAYSYGSGAAFQGPAIRVGVSAGTVGGQIAIMRIDRIGCAERRPDCPVGKVDPAHYGIQGDGLPDQGFAAILGIRLTKGDPVPNPFTALGVKRWIVELPRSGEAAGRIVLDPDDADLAAYARIRVDAAGMTPGCLVGPPALGLICGDTYFDTGAPGLRIFAARPPAPWPNGTAASLVVGEGRTTQSAAVTIGRREQATGMFVEARPNAQRTQLSLGLAPYFIWSVLYDAGRGEIGLKPR